MARPGLVLVHLVWAPLGPAPLAGFLDAYARCDPGARHRLVILLNGFAADEDLGPWRRLLEGIDHDELRVERPMLDIAAYLEAIGSVPAERYCFVNSYSVPLAEGWLAALEQALLAPGVGLVGASGSWGSLRSYNRFSLGLGGPYARVFDDRRATAAALAAAGDRRSYEQGPRRREPLRYARLLLEQSHGFLPFPAAHIRTTGFMIAHDVLCRLRLTAPRRKADAYRLESGAASITAQVRGLGLSARVVDRDGRSHEASEWPASRTFWQSHQQNLLIADNQTAVYAAAELPVRRALSRYAWGELSDLDGERRPPGGPADEPVRRGERPAASPSAPPPASS